MIVLDTEITDTTAPKLALVDPIESSGSLLLIEPGHPTAGAVPALANGAVMANLFRANALAVVGSGGVSDMDAEVVVSGTITDRVRMEYTAKKGIHGYATQVDGVVPAGTGVLVSAKAGLRAFAGFKKATGHDIFYSVWQRTTRQAVAQNTILVEHGSAANAEQNVIFRKTTIQFGDGSNVALPGASQGADASGLGLLRRSTGARTANASLDNTANVLGAEWGAPAGSYNNAVAAFRDDLPSWVLYRFYVEDLTVSGRTYAEVDAIDAALYSAAFGAGGRYAGDTFTDPATLP